MGGGRRLTRFWFSATSVADRGSTDCEIVSLSAQYGMLVTGEGVKMRHNGTVAGMWQWSLRALATGGVCVLVVEQPLLAAGVVVGRRGKKNAPVVKQIQGDERVLHALNRLTFGPRPGDVAAVQADGMQPEG